MDGTDRRVLIVTFDALRPDMVTPELMPNLCAFAEAGVRFSHSRSTFPTETRVNQTSFVTGCHPARHGIVGNKFMDPVASPGKLFNTGDEDQLAEGDRRLNGKLVDVPVLGEILDQHGMKLAVISAGTPGGTRMLHHKAEALGAFRLSLHRPDASVPAEKIAQVIERVGPIPPHEIPTLSWLTYTVDAYIDYVEPELMPEVTVLWLCEPDNSYHHKGIGSPDNLAAIRHADAEFGRILKWRETSGLGERLQVLTISDHGQIAVAGEALDLAAKLSEAGFSVGEAVDEAAEGNADLALALDSAGGINVRDNDPEITAAVVAWLRQQPWCGPVFTRTDTGGLAQSLINLDHPRAPDIALALRSDDSVNGFGQRGATAHDSGYPVDGGLHGGLHELELATWFAASGDAFRCAETSDLPTGIVDILPTVLHLLDLEVPADLQGRLLREALLQYADEAPPAADETTHSSDTGTGARSHLSVSSVGDSTYLNRAWVE